MKLIMNINIKTFPVSLEHTIDISPTVKHFIFKTKDDYAFNFTPGQFITLHFEQNGKHLRRSYSIANYLTDNHHIEFAANYIEHGPGSELLFKLLPGDTIQINGPFGRLTLKPEIPQRYILIATSTGVTPYRSMRQELEHRMQVNPTLQVIILFGARNQAEVLYANEFLEWAEKCSRFNFHASLSRANTDKLCKHERIGYVQTALSALNLNPNNDVIYLCGNPAMIDHNFEMLKNLGFTTQNVIREKYISSGT